MDDLDDLENLDDLGVGQGWRLRSQAAREIFEGQMTEEIERLSEAWFTAWFEKDAATVDALMTTDYEYTGPNGQIMDRATVLSIICSPRYALTSGTRTEVRLVGIAPDVVAVKDRWQGSGTYEGKCFTDDHRCTRLWVRRNGRWLLAHEHCSPVGP